MKRRWTLLLISMSLLLTSCHPGTQMEVVNNAGQDLTVVSMDTELKEAVYSVGSNQTVRIKVPYKLRVQHKDGIWNYDLPSTPPPKNFRKRIRGNWYLEKYQIEKDGAIYVKLPDSQGLTDLPPQPAGFPVRAK